MNFALSRKSFRVILKPATPCVAWCRLCTISLSLSWMNVWLTGTPQRLSKRFFILGKTSVRPTSSQAFFTESLSGLPRAWPKTSGFNLSPKTKAAARQNPHSENKEGQGAYVKEMSRSKMVRKVHSPQAKHPMDKNSFLARTQSLGLEKGIVSHLYTSSKTVNGVHLTTIAPRKRGLMGPFCKAQPKPIKHHIPEPKCRRYV